MNHVSVDELDNPTDSHLRETPAPRRRGALMGAIAVCALLIGGGATAYTLTQQSAASPAAASRPTMETSTAKIERGTLSGVSQAAGTLDFADKRAVGSGTSGIVTATAAVGSRVSLGDGLYWVSNVPVLLLHGPLPAWRAFGWEMSDGPDILQLETSLAALGYFDRIPDVEFSGSTEQAIGRWQKALGLEQTGRLELGSVVFMAGDVRIESVEAGRGTQVGPGGGVLTVTSLDKHVQVDLKPADQRLAAVGGKVTISLPGGTDTTGTVTAVGAPVEEESNGQKSLRIPVTVALDDPTAVADLQRSSVTLGFPSEQRDDVLSVPVEALLALKSGVYGVDIVGADGTLTQVPVTTGLFADGRVEISGDGIAAGDDVVVPAA